MENPNISQEFTNKEDQIHNKQLTDPHFRKTMEEYHTLDREIQSVESGAVVATGHQVTELRKKRTHLKNNIFEMLQEE